MLMHYYRTQNSINKTENTTKSMNDTTLEVEENESSGVFDRMIQQGLVNIYSPYIPELTSPGGETKVYTTVGRDSIASELHDLLEATKGENSPYVVTGAEASEAMIRASPIRSDQNPEIISLLEEFENEYTRVRNHIEKLHTD